VEEFSSAHPGRLVLDAEGDLLGEWDADRLAQMLKAPQFIDVSLNNWLRRLPAEAVTAHLNLGPDLIAKIPAVKELVIQG